MRRVDLSHCTRDIRIGWPQQIADILVFHIFNAPFKQRQDGAIGSDHVVVLVQGEDTIGDALANTDEIVIQRHCPFVKLGIFEGHRNL